MAKGKKIEIIKDDVGDKTPTTPVEKKVVLKQQHHVRFSDAPWYSTFYDIIICGCGGIGSWAALALARMGHSLTLYDDDTVDDTNLGGQLFGKQYIRQPKVEAIKSIIKVMCDVDVIANNQRITPKDGLVSEIMVSAFDNMLARKVVFEKWKALESRELLIEGRMGAEHFEIYFITKGMEEEYAKTLFDDKEVKDAPCSFKATTHTGMMIGSVIATGLTNYITNKITGQDIREVPFCTKWYGPIIGLKNEYIK